jgi:hypothetical protein
VYVPLEHGYVAWENKDKSHNGDHTGIEDKDCMSH